MSESNYSVPNPVISDKLLEDIHSIDLADAIGSHVQLKQKGKSFVGLCPFHEEGTPSFHVFPNDNRYKCFGCNKSGDLISFFEELNHTDFPTTVKEIASRFNMVIESSEMSPEEIERYNRKEKLYQVNKFAADWFREQLLLPENEVAFAYANNRWNKEAIESARLGFAPDNWDSFKSAALKEGHSEEILRKAELLSEKEGKTFAFFKNRLMFPLCNSHNRIIGFAGRDLSGGEKSPKYLNSPTTELYKKSSFLYGLNLAIRSIRKSNEVFLVEGYADVIRMQQLGIFNVVGLCGTDLSKEHLAELKRLTDSITIIGDSDKPGQKSVKQSAELVISAGIYCKVIPLPLGEEKSDPDSFFKSSEHFSEYETSHKENYLFRYAKDMKRQKLDPDIQIKLISDMVRLLINLPADSHDLYIKELSKIIPTRKIWSETLQRSMKARVTKKAGSAHAIPVKENRENQQLIDQHDFYIIHLDKKGDFKSITIDRVNFIERLKSFGFFRYDLSIDNEWYVQVVNNTVTEVSSTLITDRFDNFIDNLQPLKHNLSNGTMTIDSTILKNKMYAGLDSYFSRNLLNRLTPDQPIIIKKDTIDTKFIYYQNGFVSITKDGPGFHQYDELAGYVWSNQILSRNYNTTRSVDALESPFRDFVFNICGKSNERFQAMKTIMGYIMHNFTDCKLFAIILTDAQLSMDGEPNGRTGKTLWGRGIGQIMNANDYSSRVLTEISGKDFKPFDKFKYSGASIDTQVIHINDIYKNFNIESVFNDITEGIEIDKKNEKPFRIMAKLIFSTNKTIKIEGESAKDRVVQFEFADHYNSKHSPEDEFGHWFFRDWNELQWQAFDDFMISCVHDYFQHGIIKVKEINLGTRELYDHTCPDFVHFMDDCLNPFSVNDPTVNGGKADSTLPVRIISGEHVYKKDLFESFITNNTDWNSPKFKQREFTAWVRKYCKIKNLQLEEKRPGGKDVFIFGMSRND